MVAATRWRARPLAGRRAAEPAPRLDVEQQKREMVEQQRAGQDVIAHLLLVQREQVVYRGDRGSHECDKQALHDVECLVREIRRHVHPSVEEGFATQQSNSASSCAT